MTPEQLKKHSSDKDCKAYSPLLGQYFDGRLNNKLTWQIKNHIAVCAACADVVSSLSAVQSLLVKSVRHEVSDNFTALLEARIAAMPKKTGIVHVIARYWRSLGIAAAFRPYTVRLIAAPAVAALVLFTFAMLVIRPTTAPVSVGSAPVNNAAPTTAQSDPSLVQTCVDQHRTVADSDPLSDTSALVLTSRVDNIPVQPGQSQSLSNDDAAVLLDEEM